MNGKVIIQLSNETYLEQTSPGCYHPTTNRADAVLIPSAEHAKLTMMFLDEYPDAKIIPATPQ